ncbi:MAG: hypothetical protein K8R92_00620 [Planctomycetes bacterium]|nr:hypothetical protein [Planctomycetota bacterium]
MILRVLRALNRSYPFVVFFGYLAAFVLAFICMFSFPLGALVLVIGSVLSLALVVFVGEVLLGVERILARRALRRRRCPACRMGPVQTNSTRFHCLGCGSRFESNGSAAVDAEEEPAPAEAKFAAVK